MDRRRFLHGVATASALALTGCTAENRPPGDGDGAGDETPTTSPPPTTTEPVTIDDVSFAVTGIEGSGTPGADVSFDTQDGAVRVEGVIQGANGCKTGVLEAVDYDAETDAVTLSVVTADRPDAGDACTQQLVFVSYEAVVSVSGGLPSHAVVTHDGTEVASGTR